MNLSDIAKPTLDVPRAPGEPDVVLDVYELMTGLGYRHAEQWLQDPQVREANGVNAALQRFLINRSLRLALGRSDFNTSISRFVLDDTTEYRAYLKNVKEHVIPMLIKIH